MPRVWHETHSLVKSFMRHYTSWEYLALDFHTNHVKPKYYGWPGLATGVTPAVFMAAGHSLAYPPAWAAARGFCPGREIVKLAGAGAGSALPAHGRRPSLSANTKNGGSHLECAGRARAATALSGNCAAEPPWPPPASTPSGVARRLSPAVQVGPVRAVVAPSPGQSCLIVPNRA
jgi:hypothetical protein